MKTLARALPAFLMAAFLGACGAASDSTDGAGASQVADGIALRANPALFSLKSYNINTNCLYFDVNQHGSGTNPPHEVYEYFPAMKPCLEVQPYESLTITYTNGQPWNGSAGDVTIKMLGNASCMTDVSPYTGGSVAISRLRWRDCRPQPATDQRAKRQVFHLSQNTFGAVQIQSFVARALGSPSAPPACVERTETSYGVELRACALANWMLVRKN